MMPEFIRRMRYSDTASAWRVGVDLCHASHYLLSLCTEFSK